MFDFDRDRTIFLIEEYYCSRMDELFEQERFDDSNSIFEEFVVPHQDVKWIFLEDLTNVS